MDANFGSQGQHRSLVLSLKLAEIKLIESITKETPILLLDDVMSELDNNRQLKLLETISQDIQTFITTTTLRTFKKSSTRYKNFHYPARTNYVSILALHEIYVFVNFIYKNLFMV